MANLRYILAISLALLLVSRPAIKLASAQDDDDDFANEGFGDEGGDEFPEGDDLDDGEGFEGGGFEAEDEIPEGDDGDVIALTSEKLEEKVKSGKPFLLEFYAPWCGHCKSLAPEFREAASALKEYDVSLCKMDATKFDKAAADYGVEGYPTILWVVGKTVKQYNGGRTSADMVTWVKKKVGFAVTTLTTVDDAKKTLEDNSAIVAGYFKDFKSKEALAFAEAGKDADDINFVQTDKADVAQALGVPAGKAASIAVIKKQEDKFVEFDGPVSVDAISQFATANRLPLFVVFSDDTAQLIFGGSVKKMMFLFFPDSEYVSLTKSFAPIARANKGKVIFIYVNSTDENMENVREFFGVSATDKVALGFSTEKREDGEKYQMDTPLNADNLKVFVDDFAAGKAKAFFKSEPIPEKNDEPVTVVVGNNFEKIVLDETKDVLLEVYAPWCGHCKALEPIYEKLGEKFADVSSVVIAKMDGTANEHADVKVEGFPTLLFYPAQDKQNPVSVDAERKLSALANFIKEHASISFELPEISPEEEGEEGDDDVAGEDMDEGMEDAFPDEDNVEGERRDEL